MAAKPLQIGTWSLLTVYRNLPTPYATVLLLTPMTYRLATIHKVREIDDRQGISTDKSNSIQTPSTEISLIASYI